MKRSTGVRIHRRVEGEKRDVNTTTATAIAEYTRIPRSKGAPIAMGMRQEVGRTRVASYPTDTIAHGIDRFYFYRRATRGRRRSRDPFPADRNVKLLRARGPTER